LPLLFSSITGFVGCNNNTETGMESGNSSSGEIWKTGIALYSFHHHPFTTALAMADSAGVKYVEGFL
jgi:L-ribulose-5-phosphate 3-epimerase